MAGKNGKTVEGVTDGEIIGIEELLPDNHNARKHTPRNVGMIVDALHEVGTARSGVIDENGKLLAGNATAEALAQAGIRHVKVVDSNGTEWVVVRRRGLSEQQKKRLALYDNRTAEFAFWDISVLDELNAENLLDNIFSPEEWAKMGYDNSDPEGFSEGKQFGEHYMVEITVDKDIGNSEQFKEESQEFAKKWNGKYVFRMTA